MIPKCLFRFKDRSISFIVCASASAGSVLSQNITSDSITNRVHNIPNVTVKAHRAPNKVSSTIPILSIRKDAIDNLEIQSISDAVKRYTALR